VRHGGVRSMTEEHERGARSGGPCLLVVLFVVWCGVVCGVVFLLKQLDPLPDSLSSLPP
jgi:hypothetical protein